MRRRISAIVLLCLVCLLGSGCNGSRETDQIAYVLLVGVDRADDDNLEFSFQIAVPRSFGAGSSSSPKDVEEATELLAVKAKSFAEARDLANSTAARILSLAHVKGFVVGEKVAREGIAAALPALPRFREYRGSMFLIVVNQGTAKDFIEKNNPKLEVSPARYIETMMLSSAESSSYLPTNIHEYFVRLKNGGGAPYATLVASNAGHSEVGRDSGADRAGDYVAGEMPRKKDSGNPSEFLGVAIFNGDRMVGYLDNKQTRGLALLEGKFRRGFISVADPLVAGKNINVEVKEGRQPRIKAVWNSGQAAYAVDVLIEGEITAIASGIHYEASGYRELLEQQIATVIAEEIKAMLKKTQALGSDVSGLGYRLWPQFDNYQQVLQVDWPETYRQADVTVNVVAKIRRTGFMTKTSPDQLGRREE